VAGSAITAILLLITLLGTACTPSGDVTTTSLSAPPTTTLPPTGPDGSLLPPETPDPEELAASWLEAPSGLTETDEIGLFEQDALTAIGLWLPDDLVTGRADAVYTGADTSIVVAAIVPTMSWRADPGLVPALASLDSLATEVAPSVFETTTNAGLDVWLWSNGDGFLAVTSLDRRAAIDYLVGREERRVPLRVWETGDCLYFEPDKGLPWAPVTIDRVVPCDGAHNAETLLARQVAMDDTAFDEDAVAYQRNYSCDEAYQSLLGPQKDRTPSLVTYMPDADEFARGDRYLACLAQIDTNAGWELFVGRLADRTDLEWSPIVGTCYGASIAPVGIDCASAHTYQYIGNATTDLDAWPASEAAFADACATLVDQLEPGPAVIDVLPMGLYPFAFEQGDRTVRCMAFASGDDGVIEVIGSFRDRWRVLGEGGIPA